MLHAAACWFLTGLVWFVQVVHYPLMGEAGTERFVRYEQLHQRRTTWIVAPAMTLEAALALWLLLEPPAERAVVAGGRGGGAAGGHLAVHLRGAGAAARASG